MFLNSDSGALVEELPRLLQLHHFLFQITEEILAPSKHGGGGLGVGERGSQKVKLERTV